jgi:glycosyltransferase involved in cell wall biosynthesis
VSHRLASTAKDRENESGRESRGRRLGIISGSPAFRDAGSGVWLNHSIARLFEALRERIPLAKLCLPITRSRDPHQNHELKFPGDAVVDLPPLASTLKAQTHYWATRRIIRRFAADCDLLFVRLPFQLPTALHGLRRPKLLHVVGNAREVIAASTSYGPFLKKLALGFAAHTERSMKRLVAEPNTRVATNGTEMWQRLRCRHGRVVVSSCLRRGEMRPRTDWKLHEPPRLLFIGYIRPEKGCLLLLEAFERLRRMRPLKLTLAGGSSRPSQLEQTILERVRTSEFSEDISVPGLIPFGEPLFDLYRSHDVHILPTFSEGTPRTLTEARAFGCPVIATRVGGIPDSVDEGRDGLLIPPNNVDALVQAVARMLDDDALRRRLIQTGLERSANWSLEHFADELACELDLLAAQIPAQQ